jgi:uncharacterized tellurite resistance protein B-like protein
MLDRLKKWLSSARDDAPALGLEQAVAALLYEMARMDYEIKEEDLASARRALVALFAADEAAAAALLEQARAGSNRLTSYHEPLSAINATFTIEQKILLIEHLWRVAHADDSLHEHEDHLVRKIADLLYVPHVQTMLARQRARERET